MSEPLSPQWQRLSEIAQLMEIAQLRAEDLTTVLALMEIATARRRSRADRIRRMTQQYHARKRGWKPS